MKGAHGLCWKGPAGVVCAIVLSFSVLPSLGLASEVKPKSGLPPTISIGSLAPGTAAHAWATGLANIVSNNTSMKLLVQSQPGPAMAFPLMEKRSLDLVGCASPEAYWAFRGEHGYKEITGGKGYRGLRLLFMDSDYIVGIVTGTDTVIKTTRDLKGKNIALVDLVHLSPHFTVRAAVANGGLTEKDVIFVPVASASEGKKLTVEKKVDATSTPFGAADVEEIKAARGARWVSLDPSPEAMKRFQSLFPATPKLVKAGTATGIIEDTWFCTFRQAIAAWETFPDAAVHAILQAVWDNVEKYREVHGLMRDLTRERLATTQATLPYHPGAIKFFKDKGLWNKELEGHQQALFEGKR